MQKEQSSNSTPKTKSALLDKYEKQNEEANQKEVDGYERLKKKESDKKKTVRMEQRRKTKSRDDK